MFSFHFVLFPAVTSLSKLESLIAVVAVPKARTILKLCLQLPSLHSSAHSLALETFSSFGVAQTLPPSPNQLPNSKMALVVSPSYQTTK